MSKQPILLRLDASAIYSLFPEGTQARADLQQAVVAEFIRKNIKPSALGDDVRDQIERARSDALSAIKSAKDEMTAKVLADQGVGKVIWGHVELKNEAKQAINEAARAAVRDEISKVIREQIETQAQALRGTISHDAQAAVNRMIDSEIRAAVKARVAAVVEQLGKGAL